MEEKREKRREAWKIKNVEKSSELGIKKLGNVLFWIGNKTLCIAMLPSFYYSEYNMNLVPVR